MLDSLAIVIRHQLILKLQKKYDAVSVPMPFFGRFKSRIPLKAPTPSHQGYRFSLTVCYRVVIFFKFTNAYYSITQEFGHQSTATNENELGAPQAMIDSEWAVNDMELLGAGHDMLDGLRDAVVETSGKYF